MSALSICRRRSGESRLGQSHHILLIAAGNALLVAIYKNEKFPIELRADCAKAAIRFEKPALSAVENTGNIGTYVAHMPAPVADLEEWKKLHMSKHKQEPDPALTENMEKIRREAEAKKGQLQ